MSDVAYIGPGGRAREPRRLLRILVGDVLRRSRLEQRRTLSDVARHARVSVPYLSEVERGLKEVSSEVLASVCDALRIDLSDLLAEVWRDLAKDRTPVVRVETARFATQLAPPPRLASPARPPTRRSGRFGDALLLAA